MRVHPDGPEALQALISVLRSIDSVHNGRAVSLLLLAFASAGLMLSLARGAMAQENALLTAPSLGAAFFALLYGSCAAGQVLMDEATGRPLRTPAEAMLASLRTAHRLLLVVLCVLVMVALLGGAVLALLWAARLPAVGPAVLGLTVPLVVPLVGLVTLALVTLVGPLAAPAVWAGLGVRAVLALLAHQVRHRFVQTVLLSTAVSLLAAAITGLSSFVVLAGGRALLALAVGVVGLDLAPDPFLAALFGQGLRMAAGTPALSAHSSAALSGAGVVFALGLVLPGVVYLRGLCQLFLALQRLDGEVPPDPDSRQPPA